MHYGLINITTSYQNPDYQRNKIKEIFPDTVFYESLSSILEQSKDGDIIIVTDIIKLYEGDTSKENDYIFNTIFETYQYIFNQGIDMIFTNQRFLDSNIYKQAIKHSNNTKNIAATVVSYVLNLQMEITVKEQLNARTKTNSRIKNSIKNSSGQIGRKKGIKVITKKEQISKEFMKLHLITKGGDLTDSEIMEQLNISRNTFYKYKRELLAEEKQITGNTSSKKKWKMEKEKNNNTNQEVKKEKQMSITDFL